LLPQILPQQIIVEDDYSNQTMKEANFIVMSDILSKFDKLSPASLIKEGSSGSLLNFESTAEETNKFSTTDNSMNLDDIVDIFDLYLTNTNNDTDTFTTDVTDEEQVATFHLESATSDNASLTANIPSVDAIIETCDRGFQKPFHL
jgi:hypothetical protein